MLNQSGVTKTTGMARKTILFDTQLRFALPVMISNNGVSADENGKKIVKAGTPIAGSLTDRDTAFTVAKDSGEGTKTSNAVGILEHDVDVTAGNANGSCIIFGFIDVDKLDASVVELLTDAAKSNLKNVQFIK